MQELLNSRFPHELKEQQASRDDQVLADSSHLAAIVQDREIKIELVIKEDTRATGQVRLYLCKLAQPAADGKLTATFSWAQLNSAAQHSFKPKDREPGLIERADAQRARSKALVVMMWVYLFALTVLFVGVVDTKPTAISAGSLQAEISRKNVNAQA